MIGVRSVGCIMAEIWSRHTLFQGDSEIDQINKIFNVLGTPNEEVWPGWSSLPYYRDNFPDWPAAEWLKVVPSLGEDGCDLLGKLLLFEPRQRQDLKDALLHPFVCNALVNDPDLGPRTPVPGTP